MSRRKLMVTTVFAAMACVAMTAGAAVTDFAAYVPGDFLIYYGFPYSAETAAKIDAMPSSKMMQDEQFMKAMDDFFASIPLKAGKGDFASKAGLSWKDLFALKHGGFAMAFDVKMITKEIELPEGAQLPPGTKPPVMTLPQMEGAIYADKSNPEIKAVLDKVMKALDLASAEGPDKSLEKKEVNIGNVKAVYYADVNAEENAGAGSVSGIYVFDQGDMTVLAAGEALAGKIIDYVAGKGNDSLAKSELYTKAMAKLGDKRINAMFINVGEQLARFHKQIEEQPDAANATKAMNFDSLQAIVGADWLDENGSMSQFYLYCPDGKFALLKPFQNGRANFATLDGVSKKSFAFVSVSIDPLGLWDWAVSLMQQTDKKKYDSFNKDLQDSEKEIGVKFRDDILAALGGEMTIVMTSPSLQGDAKMPVPVALVAELKDKVKAEQIVAKIYETEKLKPEIEEYGTAKHKINILPMAAVCMTDKYCIIANGSRTMEDILDIMDGEGAKIAGTDHFKKAAALLGGNNAVLFYVNMKDVANVMENIDKWQDAFGKTKEPSDAHPEGMEGGEVPPPDDQGEEVPAPDTPFALAALAVFIRGEAVQPAEGDSGAEGEDTGTEEEELTEGENPDNPDATGEEAVPGEDWQPQSPEDFPMPKHGIQGKEMLKKVAALLKVMANYTPSMYVGIAADNEGMSIKLVVP